MIGNIVLVESAVRYRNAHTPISVTSPPGWIILCNHEVDSLQDVTETRPRKRHGLDCREVERLIWTNQKDSRFYK